MVRTLQAVTLPSPRALSTSTIPVLCPIDFAWPVKNNEREEVVGFVAECVFFVYQMEDMRRNKLFLRHFEFSCAFSIIIFIAEISVRIHSESFYEAALYHLH